MSDELKKVENTSLPEKKRQRLTFSMFAPDEDLQKSSDNWEIVEKSVLNSLTDIQRGGSLTRLAFTVDPLQNKYQALWLPKQNQVPDEILKRISIRDDLVAAVVHARASHVSMFGRELQDRFAVGFKIEPRKGIMNDATPAQKAELLKRIQRASKLLSTCGHIDGVERDDRMSFSTFLYQQARNAVVFGRFATEITHVDTLDGSEREFHSFRPVDAGTIYQCQPEPERLDNVRKQALRLIEKLQNKKLKAEKFENDEYAWVQVMHGKPEQAFGPEELLVHNVYPVTDLEYVGYPITPIDTAIDAILTHMNITAHNKLYFQAGRAARGMVIIKSNDINQDIVGQIRQHFQASINSVANSWRVPVFGIDPEEDVTWEPLEMQGGRDMEFQYLADSNARVILSAFQMSPEELPGYAHLSRGTNNQALSESNNEYKLEAARDVGIRPLLNHFQDFINEDLLPLIDPMVAKFCTLKLHGLDADTREKENTNLQTEAPLHETYDGILNRVEKPTLGAEWGGEYPLNPGLQGIHDKYLYVNEIVAHFFKRPDALKDENLKYIRDPFYFNYQQLKLQTEQMKQQENQMQMQQQQEAQAQQQEQQGGEDQKGDDEGGEPQGELASGVDQLMQALGKSEAQLPPNKRRLLAQHRTTVKTIMDEWEKEAEKVKASAVKLAKDNKPKKV